MGPEEFQRSLALVDRYTRRYPPNFILRPLANVDESSWAGQLRQRIAELEATADWAGRIEEVGVRALCLRAVQQLQESLQRQQRLAEALRRPWPVASPPVDLRPDPARELRLDQRS